MSEWLTGSQIENIRSYFDPEQESADICEVVDNLLADRERLLGLVKKLTEGNVGAEFPTASIIEARACLKAQEE